jgi:hypothetical protein
MSGEGEGGVVSQRCLRRGCGGKREIVDQCLKNSPKQLCCVCVAFCKDVDGNKSGVLVNVR